MKILMKWRWLALVFAAVAIPGSYLAWGRSRSPALIVVSVQTQEVVARQGESEVKVEYTIRNNGGSDLILGTPTTTCGCSVASIEPKVVPPGGSATVKVVGTPPPVGRKAVTILIPTNLVAAPEISLGLEMVGAARPPYAAFYPPTIALGQIRTAGTATRFKLTTREKADAERWVVRATASDPTLRLESVTKDLQRDTDFGDGVASRDYLFNVIIRNVPPTGAYRTEISFWSNASDREPVLKIPVHGHVKAAVYASPSGLFAAIPDGGPSPTIRCMIRADDPGLVLQVEPPTEANLIIEREEARGAIVVFRITPRPSADGAWPKHLTFRTNHPEVPTLSVPLTLKRG